MANKQDIITAIKNLDKFLKISELKNASVKLNANGTPFLFTGGFNMVFQLNHNFQKWAFRVWHVPIGENKERYRTISKYLTEKKLPYFADFIYDEKGLLVSGELLDTIRMKWLEGLLLKEYIEQNLTNKKKIENLANDFLEMTKILRKNSISHGDLQEGNILVEKSGNIKLVDYDSVCIPEIEGQKELVVGLKGYQHPSRFEGSKASLKADYFSELVIYISILTISENPNLWDKYKVKDTRYLLFSENDFNDFKQSQIYSDLQLLSNSIKILTNILDKYIQEKSYINLFPFESYLVSPLISHFESNLIQILDNNEIEIKWKVENADNITIDNNIGSVKTTGLKKIRVLKNTTYKLSAENFFGKVEHVLHIEVLPQPKIVAFRAKQVKIGYGDITQLVWEVENIKKIQLKFDDKVEELSNSGEKTINPTKHTIYKFIFTALDDLTTIEQEITIQVFKKVEIKNFTCDFDFIIESLPVKLSWQIENASNLTLMSNIQSDIDVTGKNEIEISPKRTSIFYLKARNDLFESTSNSLKLEVQNLPTMPRLDNIIPSDKNLIPFFDLNFKEISEEILTKSQIDFENAMSTKRKFSLLKNFKSLIGK